MENKKSFKEAISDIQFLARRYEDLDELNMTIKQESLDLAIKSLMEIEKYQELGTFEELKAKLEELERWHTNKINENIKNPFAYTSTLICHNCDHKDEYIEELEYQLEKSKK